MWFTKMNSLGFQRVILRACSSLRKYINTITVLPHGNHLFQLIPSSVVNLKQYSCIKTFWHVCLISIKTDSLHFISQIFKF